VDEDAFAALAESFHSEGGRIGRRTQAIWGRDRHAGSASRNPPLTSSIYFDPHPQTSPDPSDRGRPLQRDESLDAERWNRGPTTSESGNETSSRASRKGAGMVFLAIWALFGVGSLAGARIPVGRTSLGKVLAAGGARMPDFSNSMVPAISFETIPPQSSDTIAPPFMELEVKDRVPIDLPEKDRPSKERIIGRIFAWLCTTLYLTSRLPQIWKNVCF
jgi:solute carrier family 66 (lysosomal lysine-arginine transporter), member 1